MTELIEILGFKKIPRKQISKYLLSDIDDDWFQDPIRYADFVSMKKEIDVITKNIHDNVGRYVAGCREVFYVPKSNFTLRYTLETDYYDRWMFLFLTVPLMEKFDPLLSNRIYSHRYYGGERFLFHNRIRQWEKFEGIVRSQAKGKVVVETDIQNYYENISLEILEKKSHRLFAKSKNNSRRNCRM